MGGHGSVLVAGADTAGPPVDGLVAADWTTGLDSGVAELVATGVALAAEGVADGAGETEAVLVAVLLL